MEKSEFLRRFAKAVESYGEQLDACGDPWMCAQLSLRQAGLPAHGATAGGTVRPSPLMTAVVHCHHAVVAPAAWVTAEVEVAWKYLQALRLAGLAA
jgi:hypothetical protein